MHCISPELCTLAGTLRCVCLTVPYSGFLSEGNMLPNTACISVGCGEGTFYKQNGGSLLKEKRKCTWTGCKINDFEK